MIEETLDLHGCDDICGEVEAISTIQTPHDFPITLPSSSFPVQDP